MTYSDAIQFLYRLRWFGAKFGLANTLKLAALAGNPQEQLRFIHIAGTNGKGSTAAMLESIYRAAGLRVGLFTSPHLVAFGERMQINRQLVSESEIVGLATEMRAWLEKGWGRIDGQAASSAASLPALRSEQPAGREHPTFFEVVTVMALCHFARQHCDLVIWETGLGGRLDATNIVTPLASVITNIQYDHQKWLGETLASIAAEKAGIIKPGVPVITATAAPEALEVIVQAALSQGAPLTRITTIDTHQPPLDTLELPLLGEHQRLNAALAVATVRQLAPQLQVTNAHIRSGLARVHWPGRLQLITRSSGQRILLDGAHNPGGADVLAVALAQYFGAAKPTLILGILQDKDWPAMCQRLAPLADRILLVPVPSERSAAPSELAAACQRANSAAPVKVYSSLSTALADSTRDPFIVICGSLYLIGEAMELLQLSPSGGCSERELNEWQTAAPAPHVAPNTEQAGRSGLHSSKLRAITFDVGGTLIEPWPSVGHVYAAVAARHGCNHVSAELLNERFAAAWRALQHFSHTRAEWAELVDATFRGLVDVPPSQTFFSELYSRFTEPEAWRIYPDVVATLKTLAGRGLKLGLISNWDERLEPLMHQLDLVRYFDIVVVSYAVGCSKPALGIFQEAARKLELSPGEILHVGDSLEMDVHGARSAGFDALLLARSAANSARGQIRSLLELTDPGS